MALLSRTLLSDLGIEMADQDYALLEEHFETTLRNRVINEVVEGLSPEQAEELATMQNESDERLMEWLLANVPDFSDVVSDEVDILLGELADNSEAFNSSSADSTPEDEHF